MCRIKILPARGDGSCFFHCIEMALGLLNLRDRLTQECLDSEKYKKHYDVLRSRGAVDVDIFEFVSEALDINILVLLDNGKDHYFLYPFQLYYSKEFIQGMNNRRTVILKFQIYGHFDLVTLAHKGGLVELSFPFSHWFISKLIEESKTRET
jgi:hypothetical protein